MLKFELIRRFLPQFHLFFLNFLIFSTFLELTLILEKTNPSVSSNLTKRKKQKSKARSTYRLVFTNEKGETSELTAEEFEAFAKKYPKVSAMIRDPSTIPKEMFDENYESWDDVALQILNAVWKLKGANYFHKPVDVVRFGIPDYYSVIKNPMDLSTVKVWFEGLIDFLEKAAV